MLHIGKGCLTTEGDNSVFNPKPTTARGKRRHERRSESKKAIAVKAWDKAKSNHPRNCRPKLKGSRNHE